MAQLLSADLPPELVFPSEFPYEVFDTLPSDISDDDDSDYLDYNLFFPGLSRRRLTHSSIFNGVQTRRLAKSSSFRCDGIPVVKKLSVSPNSTLGGTDNWSTPAGVSQLPYPSLIPFRSSDADRFDLVHAAAALQLERLKVATEKPSIGTCHPYKSSLFRYLPEQDQVPSSLNRDPLSLPCFGQSTMRRNAREVEFVKQRHDALLLAQQTQLQIQAQIRAKKLGFAEGSRFGRTYSFPQPGWASKVGPPGNRSVSAGTGVFLPRGYCDVAPESTKISGGPNPSVVVPSKVVWALNNANVQLQGRDELLLETRKSTLDATASSSSSSSSSSVSDEGTRIMRPSHLQDLPNAVWGI